MAQEIEVLLTKQFDEVQIDQFAIDWLVRQTAEFGEPGRIAERLLGIVSDLPPIVTGTFASSSGWTVGANWSIGSGKATYTSGAPNALTRSEERRVGKEC